MAASRQSARLVVGVVALTTFVVLPVFLVGALSLQIRQEIPIRATEFGVAASAYFGISALASTPMGRLAQHLGSAAAMRWAGLAVAGMLWGVGLFARSWTVLLLFLGVAGVANALGQPAANLALAQGVRVRRGLAFGLKQGAVPVSTLLAGLAVPLAAGPVHWRALFGLAGCGAAVSALAASPRSSSAASPRLLAGSGGSPRPVAVLPLLLLSAGGALAAAAVNAYGIFFVDAAVFQGWRENAAGQLLAVASTVGLLVRVGAGWLVDRRGADGLAWVSGLMVIGGAGFALLVPGSGTAWLFAVGSLLAFGAGWGWPGLFHYAVVQENSTAAATATGIAQSGVWLGGVAGPLWFGFASEQLSYGVAFASAAVALGAGAAAAVFSKFIYARQRLPENKEQRRCQ